MKSNRAQHAFVTPSSELPSEKVFQYINIIIVFVPFFCINGFMEFRQYCNRKDFYVVQKDSIIWSLYGFVALFIFKHSYKYFMNGRMAAILHPKYSTEVRAIKLRQLIDLSFDSVYYSLSWLLGFYLFRDQYWFPSTLGGSGKCNRIYKQYPNWPQERQALEKYIMFQLGMSLFTIFELLVFDRKTQRKFFELLLHHCLEFTIILFAIMCNKVTAVSIGLIVLDLSNIFYVFGYGFMKTKYKTPTNTIILSIVMACTWIYLRVFFYPSCILTNFYAKMPTPRNGWYVINFEYNYLFFLGWILYGLGVFWSYQLVMLVLRSTSGNESKNAIKAAGKNDE